MARHKSPVAEQGAWLVFEDESGQGLRPPRGRTWGRRGRTSIVTVTGGSNRRVSLAALIAVKDGQQPRLVFRIHAGRHGDKRKGFTEAGYVRLLDAARQQLGGPIVLIWDNLNTRVSRAMRALVAARDWLTVFQLPAYASELNPVESLWPHLKRSLANLVKRDIAQLTSLVKTRLRRMQYRPGLIEGFLAGTRLDLTPPVALAIEDRLACSITLRRHRHRCRQPAAIYALEPPSIAGCHSCDFAVKMATTLRLVGHMGAGHSVVTCENPSEGVHASCATAR